MREYPILFSAPMVRAILEGRKTQTRRVVKPQPPDETPYFRGCIGSYSGAVRPSFFWSHFESHEDWQAYLDRDDHDPEKEEDILWPGGDSDGFTCDWYASTSGMLCPYGAAPNPFRDKGDRLWVRETFKDVASGSIRNGSGEIRYGVVYKADSAVIWKPRPTIIHDLRGFDTGPMQFEQRPWRPSIHMPRWASRITLEITDVRVQRVQNITAEDCIAEGLSTTLSEHNACCDLADQFRDLWDSINAKRGFGWDANPWVWAITFKRVGNDDGRR